LKPNIVFILTDNLGYGELGCYGGGELRGAPTPRADKLASEGMRLTNFNVEAQCTPSRSAIMTGRYAMRSGTLTVPIGNPAVGDHARQGLVGWELTIATQLSKLGYKTAHFGKWHLGSVDGRLPNDHGFDEWWGIPRTTDEVFWTSSPGFDKSGVEPQYIMEGRKGEKSRKVRVYDLEQRPLLDAEITRRTVDFMKRSVAEKKPFYAYVPLTQVHLPTTPHPDFKGKTGNGDFPDSLAETDHRLGQLLDAIDQLGIADNTIVVFTSDNGPDPTWPWQGSSGPWRGYISRTWRARCAFPSSSAGRARCRRAWSATRSCTRPTPSRPSSRSSAARSLPTAPSTASTRPISSSAARRRRTGRTCWCSSPTA
jgi:arylsulfatase